MYFGHLFHWSHSASLFLSMLTEEDDFSSNTEGIYLGKSSNIMTALNSAH